MSGGDLNDTQPEDTIVGFMGVYALLYHSDSATLPEYRAVEELAAL